MTIKKIIPIIAAVFVAFMAISLMGAREAEKTDVVILNFDLPPGHTLVEADLTVAEMPVANLPADVIADPPLVVGSVLRVSRSAGDFLAESHLGGDALELAQDERAVTIQVNDSAGLAGQLKPGDFVGVTAVLAQNDFTYAKVAAEGLKVLSVSPDFQAIDPAAYDQQYTSQGDGIGAAGVAGYQGRPAGVQWRWRHPDEYEHSYTPAAAVWVCKVSRR